MPANTPAAELAAVHAKLAAARPQIGVLLTRHDDRGALGQAAQAALNGTGLGTEAGCQAAVRALTGAGKFVAEYRGDKKHDKARAVALACDAALPALRAIVWHAGPAEQPVAIAAAFGDLTLSAAVPTPAAVRLERAGATDLAASCGWQATGPGAVRLARAAGPAVFAVGAADVDLKLEFAPAPGMAAAEAVVVSIVGPFVGLAPGAPASVTRRLLPPVVGPTLPTVSLTGPGDVTPSATAEVDASATFAVSTPADRPVGADWALSGDVADDFLGDTSGRVTIPPGQPSAPIPLRVAPLTLTADRAPVSLTLANIAGAAPPFPAPAIIRLLKNSAVVVPVTGAPKPLDPRSYANQAQADPPSYGRVSASLKPNTALGLADGHYGFTSIHVPNVLVYALNSGKVFVDTRVQLHEAYTAILGLATKGLVFDAARTRASRCQIGEVGSVDGISFQGDDQVLDWCELTGWETIGVGASKSAQRPWIYGLYQHGQKPSSSTANDHALMMFGHSHTDSGIPINPLVERCLSIAGSGMKGGVEVKSSGARFRDHTVVGCTLFQRHGLVALQASSCWVEGADLQVNGNNPRVVRCKTVGGILRVVSGNISPDAIPTSGGGGVYPYAVNAEVHDHDGEVNVGWARSGWDKPPLGTKASRCPNLKVAAGATCGQAVPIPPDQLPPAPRKLTPADVGPGAA